MRPEARRPGPRHDFLARHAPGPARMCRPCLGRDSSTARSTARHENDLAAQGGPQRLERPTAHPLPASPLYKAAAAHRGTPSRKTLTPLPPPAAASIPGGMRSALRASSFHSPVAALAVLFHSGEVGELDPPAILSLLLIPFPDLGSPSPLPSPVLP
jgi:hypothetical protein